MTALDPLVLELRRELRGEIPTVLHTHHVPRLRNRDGGIEKEPEYVAIAEARLNGTQRGLGLEVVQPA